MVYSHWSQHCYRHHRAVPNITEHSLRRCQYCRAFIVLLPTFWASSVHCAKQITNLFIAPLPTPVCRGSQRDVVYLGWSIGPSYIIPNASGRGEVAGSQPMSTADTGTWSQNKLWRSNSIFNLWLYVINKKRLTELCAPLAICFQIANSLTRWRCSFQGLSQDGERSDFSKNLRASLFNDDHQTNLISAGSISLFSKFYTAHRLVFELVHTHVKIPQNAPYWSDSKIWFYLGGETDGGRVGDQGDYVAPAALQTGRLFGRITQKGRIKSKAAGKICCRILTDFVRKMPKGTKLL
jgi:hypothetical protein